MRSALLFVSLVTLPFIALAKDPTPEPEPAARSSQVLGAPDMNREFHLKQLSPVGRSGSTFSTKAAQTQSFQFQQKFQPKGFEGHKEFRANGWWGSSFRFSTKTADTKTFETKTAETKTAAVKEASDAGKTARTKELSDGNRTYMGPEAAKLHKPLDPQNLPKITNQGRELKTIEDVKELLNKN